MRTHKFFRYFWTLATLALLFVSSQVFAGLFQTESQALPAFSLPTLANTSKQLTNKSFQGQVALLNVWASWCRYCLSEHPLLMKIKNSGAVPIYGILYRDNPDNARTYLKQNGNPYVSIGVDWSGDVGTALDVSGTPQTFIIDKHGMIREHYSGSLDESRWKDIAAKVAQYQAEK